MKFILINFLSIVLFSIQLNSQQLTGKKLPTAKNKIMVIAHRGDHTLAPENSLLSIQNAIKDGADYVELDIRTTQDSQLVLMHDATVDRMTNGHGKIAEMKFDSIRNLKLYNKNVPISDTLLVPTFEEALAICKNKINIYLDFKNADVKKVYEAIQEAHMQDQMVVYINTPMQYVEWRKQVPSMPLILSLSAKVKDSTEMFKYLSSVNIDILDGNWNEYTQETVRASLSKGVPVWADMQAAIEDEAYWNKGIELGLSGIQTDHPKELIQYLKKLSMTNKQKN
jgi:glycerophosphoryl diester phosphodiesterase